LLEVVEAEQDRHRQLHLDGSVLVVGAEQVEVMVDLCLTVFLIPRLVELEGH
jgi:hypothetical protein